MGQLRDKIETKKVHPLFSNQALANQNKAAPTQESGRREDRTALHFQREIFPKSEFLELEHSCELQGVTLECGAVGEFLKEFDTEG